MSAERPRSPGRRCCDAIAATVDTFLAARRRADLPPTEANSRIRLPRGRLRGRMGATYVGGFITARSTRTVDLAVSPARQVPGRANRPVVAVGADPRVFTAHGRAVLVAGPRQSVQEIEGVDEQYLGRATVVPYDARVARPPLLADLDWSAFGGTADAAEPDRWQLAGVVILGTGGDSDHLPMRWGSSRGDLAAWRQLLWSRSTCGSVDTLRWPDHTLEAAQFGASPSRGGFGMGR